ncbi:MAG: uroporphyrinogen decarboxylase family protein [Defluviitaleaceae bacterium]|nr:uroporphyrinogen decarboxylase family protein [Defluviitaleaceae bacterium]
MSHQDLMIKAMTYQSPEELPVGLGTLPAVWFRYGKDMIGLAKRFPKIFGEIKDDHDPRNWLGQSYRAGSYTDEWGCVWSNIEEGLSSIVTEHPVKRREDIRSLKMPENRNGHMPHGFMYLRLLDLRGFEEAMLDFADECGELQILIDLVAEYNVIQTEIMVKNSGEIIYFGDDLGMQDGLAIGPAKWRKYLKPAFAKIFAVARTAGKYVYMHTDGHIHEIIPDLFDAGVHMVNPQYRANGLDNLVRVCKGRYPINLDLDRQMFPFCTPAQCKDHVAECLDALFMPEGGLSLSIEIGPDVPLANIEALCEAAEAARYYR